MSLVQSSRPPPLAQPEALPQLLKRCAGSSGGGHQMRNVEGRENAPVNYGFRAAPVTIPGRACPRTRRTICS
jgi:hypothetical protein